MVDPDGRGIESFGLNPPLLATKMNIPAVRSQLVPRPHLIERLNVYSPCRLVLISAPAGFGKTTLIAEWAKQTSLPVVWLSLDTYDNDAVRFWTYVVAAIQRSDPLFGHELLDYLSISQPISTDALITALINEIASTIDQIALILDDYHLIDNPVIHEALSYLLDRAPSQLHLIMTTRVDPPLPLSRLRAREQLVEIRAEALRFSHDETAQFLRSIAHISISDHDVTTLKTQTEGWVTGLQLAAISLQARPLGTTSIKSIGGENHYILTYLAEEVLSQQTVTIQDFLIKTSVFERFTADLCTVITGDDNATKILEDIERANLFIMPIDDNHQWYRYHHLFAEFLRARLERDNAHLIPQLHGRASGWFERNGLLPEAIHHALVATDYDRAAGLIEYIAQSTRTRGEIATVKGWLTALPDAVLRSRPRLCLEYAWVLISMGRPTEVPVYLDEIREVLGFDEAIPTSLTVDTGLTALLSEVLAVEAKVACDTGHASRAIKLFQQAQPLLPSDDLTLQTVVALHLGTAFATNNQLEDASAAYTEAVELGHRSKNGYTTITALTRLGDIVLHEGHLRRAAVHFREALGIATRGGGQPLPVAANAFVGMGHILYEWNNLDEAADYLKQGIRLAEQGGNWMMAWQGYVALLWVHIAARDEPQATEILNTIEKLAHGSTDGRSTLLNLVRVQLAVERNDFHEAKFYLQEYDTTCYPQLDSAFQIAQIEMFIQNNNSHDALSLIERALANDWVAGRIKLQIEFRILQAIALQQSLAHDKAIEALSQAVEMAEPDGYVRTFINKPALDALLPSVAARGVATEYVGTLLKVSPFDTGRHQIQRQLVEPLTDRELEVLRLIAIGLSNKEIASELVLAISTVKRHINHIYGKLNVRSRTQAIVRAHELALM